MRSEYREALHEAEVSKGQPLRVKGADSGFLRARKNVVDEPVEAMAEESLEPTRAFRPDLGEVDQGKMVLATTARQCLDRHDGHFEATTARAAVGVAQGRLRLQSLQPLSRPVPD